MGETLYPLILKGHLLAGTLALFVAPLAMVVRKGGKWHRIWGKIYVWSMIVVVLSVLAASWFKANPLMMLVGIFSIYLILSGYRALYLKRLSQGQRPTAIDYLLHSASAIVNFGLLVWGVSAVIHSGGGFG